MTNFDQCLVVDACIARSAGKKTVGSSYYCATILDEILDAKLTICISPTLDDEWLRNASKVALIWYSTMKRKGLTKKSEHLVCHELHTAIGQVTDSGLQDALKKDVHLIEASLNRGKKIVSADRISRDGFAAMVNSWGPLEHYYWAHVNCQESADIALEWIRSLLASDARVRLVAG